MFGTKDLAEVVEKKEQKEQVTQIDIMRDIMRYNRLSKMIEIAEIPEEEKIQENTLKAMRTKDAKGNGAISNKVLEQFGPKITQKGLPVLILLPVVGLSARYTLCYGI